MAEDNATEPPKPPPGGGQGTATPEQPASLPPKTVGAPTSPPAGNRIEHIGAKSPYIQQATKIYNINFGKSQASELKRNRGKGWFVKKKTPDGESADLLVRKYEKGIQAEPANPGLNIEDDNDNEEAKKRSYQLPQTLQEINDWYINSQFSEQEKCFLQAVAVLSGASTREIQEVAEFLYRPEREAGEKALAWKARIHIDDLVPPPYEPFSLDETFLVKAYMEIREEDGAERIFWKDATTGGFSEFAVRFLCVLRRKTGRTGQSTIKPLEQLPSYFDGEIAWRVPRALGSMWFKADRDHLLQMAEEWIKQEKEGEVWWIWRAANLLFGAYEEELGELGELRIVQEGFILSLLDEWSSDAHSLKAAEPGIAVGCVIAEAYRLIAQKNLACAFRGLERLLEYPIENGDTTIPDDVFITIVLSYMMLGRFGFAQEVVEQLAKKANEYLRQKPSARTAPNMPAWKVKEITLRLTVKLYAMLHAFLLLAMTSLGEVPDNLSVEERKAMYTLEYELPEHLCIPDQRRKDTLLAGILAKNGASLRLSIAQLLSIFLFEDQHDLVFYILHEWAEIVLKVLGQEMLQVRQAYVDYLVTVIVQADTLSRELKSGQDLILRSRSLLADWQRESRQPPKPLGALASDVLKGLQNSLVSRGG